MNYIDLARLICEEMLDYPVKDESFWEVYNNIFKKHEKKHLKNKYDILVKVIHFITIYGYDIDCIKPLKFKNF